MCNSHRPALGDDMQRADSVACDAYSSTRAWKVAGLPASVLSTAPVLVAASDAFGSTRGSTGSAAATMGKAPTGDAGPPGLAARSAAAAPDGL